MLKFLARRFVLMLIAMFVIATATWFLMQTLPGTPFQDDKLSDTARERLFEQYGLDDPLVVQYARYMGNLFQGELGISFYYDNRPVLDVILNRVGPSAFLGIQALIMGAPVGLALGILAALKHNTLMDSAATTVSVLGISVPSFVLAPLLQYFVAYQWEMLPIVFFDSWAHSVLPSIVLATAMVAIVARYVRAEMLEVFGQDYVTLAKAKGINRAAVVMKHVVRNALIPVITATPALAIGLLTGSLIVERVFAIPGLGDLLIRSIAVSDYTMIVGWTLFTSLLFIITLLIQDILYGVIDPRIRVAGRGE